jgi:hypothetical protein
MSVNYIKSQRSHFLKSVYSKLECIFPLYVKFSLRNTRLLNIALQCRSCQQLVQNQAQCILAFLHLFVESRIYPNKTLLFSFPSPHNNIQNSLI